MHSLMDAFLYVKILQQASEFNNLHVLLIIVQCRRYKSHVVLFGGIVIAEHCIVAGSLVPKLVGEKKTRNDDIQSMSASVFFVLYPTLADYIVSVLKDAVHCMNNSHSQSAAKHHAPETSSPAGLGKASEVSEACLKGDASEMHSQSENVVPVVSSSLLFPVLSLLCRLSPGLEVTGEGKK